MAAAVLDPQVAAVLQDPAQFEQLLSSLMSAANEERSLAERLFQGGKSQPDALCAQLMRCLRTSSRPDAREMSAILLRKARAPGGSIHAESDAFALLLLLLRPARGGFQGAWAKPPVLPTVASGSCEAPSRSGDYKGRGLALAASLRARQGSAAPPA